MALETFTPPVAQSPGTKLRPVVKIKKADFGDGYTQKMPDGSNHIRQVAELTWASLNEDQADEIIAFFVRHKGTTPFYYALRDGIVRKWTCEAWTRSWDTPNQVTATFEEDFSLVR